KTEIKILESLDSPPDKTPSASLEPLKPKTNATPPPAPQQPKQNVPPKKQIPTKPSVPPPVRQTAERRVAYDVDTGFDDMPPPPDNFPDDWSTQWQPSFDEASIAARPEPKVDRLPVAEPHPRAEIVEAEIGRKEREQAEARRAALAVQPIDSVPTQPVEFLPSLYVPLAQEDKDKDHPPQQITVILRSTGDKEHDRRRIKTLYGTLISFHGKDRFSFQIFEEGKGHLIDFPNDTTCVCPEVLERLKKLMGEECWRVEEITFQ
ncbi:MAG TPA: hypothetical protein VKP08_22265, partial [Anaerolineales bacterium]|nr:hypothetical protein [Anaerolineales bacterium]